IPFSDPMADGPVIQKASERALAKGASLRKIIQLVKEVRGVTQIPILLMGYYNPILAYGLKQYAEDAKAAGIHATLVVDLPPEESAELDRELKKVKIPLIYLLAPTSDTERIRLVAKRARGFIYFVSMTGVTGAKFGAGNRLNQHRRCVEGEATAALPTEGATRAPMMMIEIQKKIKEIRGFTKLPIVIGFGISNPDQAARMAKMADGIVIGSALVSLIHQKRKSSDLLSTVEHFVGQMRKAVS
ncbi:MAG: tryptophan synthase subunit alpha, partial [Deltaproteobacteria bacterium]|nr:tryptophan synthase subunit alpha [Deltaproteobacteria bacterium]